MVFNLLFVDIRYQILIHSQRYSKQNFLQFCRLYIHSADFSYARTFTFIDPVVAIILLLGRDTMNKESLIKEHLVEACLQFQRVGSVSLWWKANWHPSDTALL